MRLLKTTLILVTAPQWLLALLVSVTTLLCVQCSTEAKVATAAVLTIEQLACIDAEAEFGETEPRALAIVCAISDALVPIIEHALLAKKAAMARARAARAPKSAP